MAYRSRNARVSVRVAFNLVPRLREALVGPHHALPDAEGGKASTRSPSSNIPSAVLREDSLPPSLAQLRLLHLANTRLLRRARFILENQTDGPARSVQSSVAFLAVNPLWVRSPPTICGSLRRPSATPCVSRKGQGTWRSAGCVAGPRAPPFSSVNRARHGHGHGAVYGG